MKPTLPIKILLLAATNLLLLIAIAAIFLGLPSRVSWDSLVLAPSEDRILSAARGLALDLQRIPITKRDGLLDSLRKQFGAEVYLFENNGNEVAGKPVELPEQLRKALHIGMGDQGSPPPSSGDFARDRRGPGAPPEGMPPPDAPREVPDRALQAGILPQTPIASCTDGDHGRHWVGVHIPIGSPDSADLLPGALILTTDSWFSGSLFFDFRPWLSALAAVFLATLLCWAPFLRSLTRSIRQIAGATEHIAEGEFDVQLRETRTDELGQLSQAIQRMASRLAQLVHGQKRFLGDVAHELCSPISRMQFALGILERQVPASTLADLNEEVQQMSSLVQELLQFSKASIQQPGRPLETVNLAETLHSAAQREGVTVFSRKSTLH